VQGKPPMAQSSYGKSEIRLVKVDRRDDLHDIRDMTVSVRFEGAFERAYVDGDNTMVLPTDTMKNTVYAKALDPPFTDLEPFGIALSEHFLTSTPDVRRVEIDIAEHLWNRTPVHGKPHRHTFSRASDEKRTARVVRTAEQFTVEAGLRDLVMLKTSGSGFEDFLTDRYTTLKETTDRILATAITAWWRYGNGDVPFGLRWRGIRQAMVETFADHESRSVQHTLYAMAEAAMDVSEDIREIHLSLPNRHHLVVDLSPFGLANPNEIFVATTAPYGLIEATIRR
jgi:urate oxidase